MSGTSTNYFVVDYTDSLKRPLAETDSDGSVLRYYIWSGSQLLCHIDTPAGGGEPGGSAYYYHGDGLGSTLAITDDTGSVTDEFAYMPYGYATHVAHSNSVDTPFLWMGGYGVYYDEDADLHLTLHRAYSSSLKRFLQSDPLGIDGGANLYAYGNLNPLFFIDPKGLAVLLEAHPVVTFYVPTAHPMSFNPQPPTQVSINHSKITIIPENQAVYSVHPDFQNKLPDGRRYATLGAGPEGGLGPFFSDLVSGSNRDTDRNRDHNVFSTPVTLPQGITEDQYIQYLFETDANYQDNTTYELFPNRRSNDYNSNSYASGLLNATGGTVSQHPQDAPGYWKPIPAQIFGIQK